jgi:hypothetical protein
MMYSDGSASVSKEEFRSAVEGNAVIGESARPDMDKARVLERLHTYFTKNDKVCSVFLRFLV